MAPLKKCPTCGKASGAAYELFCSFRCREVDLNRWLSGHYRVPTNERPSLEDLPEPEGHA